LLIKFVSALLVAVDVFVYITSVFDIVKLLAQSKSIILGCMSSVEVVKTTEQKSINKVVSLVTQSIKVSVVVDALETVISLRKFNQLPTIFQVIVASLQSSTNQALSVKSSAYVQGDISSTVFPVVLSIAY